MPGCNWSSGCYNTSVRQVTGGQASKYHVSGQVAIETADTRAQLQVEEWIRQEWMPSEFRQVFHAQRFQLTSGGVFDVDAVSSDGAIVASISTSGAAIVSGKNGVGNC